MNAPSLGTCLQTKTFEVEWISNVGFTYQYFLRESIPACHRKSFVMYGIWISFELFNQNRIGLLQPYAIVVTTSGPSKTPCFSALKTGRGIILWASRWICPADHNLFERLSLRQYPPVNPLPWISARCVVNTPDSPPSMATTSMQNYAILVFWNLNSIISRCAKN